MQHNTEQDPIMRDRYMRPVSQDDIDGLWALVLGAMCGGAMGGMFGFAFGWLCYG